MAPRQRPYHAIVLMLSAVACFALLDATAKHLAQTYAVPLLAWVRYATHLVIMLVVLGPSMRLRLVRTARPLALALRGLMLAVTTIAFMAAFRIMPLAETTALSFVAPLFVALAAGPLLGEHVGPARWLAVLGGLVGVVLIAHLGSDDVSIPAEGLAYALAGAAAYGIYQVQSRALSPTENTLTMLFFTALVGTAALSATLPWAWGGPLPDIRDGALMMLLGVLGGIGHLLLTRAFRFAPASFLSPFSYAQLVWAALLGWLLFDHLPDGRSLTGIAVIAASGIALAASHRRRGAGPEHENSFTAMDL